MLTSLRGLKNVTTVGGYLSVNVDYDAANAANPPSTRLARRKCRQNPCAACSGKVERCKTADGKAEEMDVRGSASSPQSASSSTAMSLPPVHPDWWEASGLKSALMARMTGGKLLEPGSTQMLGSVATKAAREMMLGVFASGSTSVTSIARLKMCSLRSGRRAKRWSLRAAGG